MAWVLVYTTNSSTDAVLIEGLLQANDIPAQVVSQVDTMRALSVGALAIAKVYVPIDCVREAEELISSLPKPDELSTD